MYVRGFSGSAGCVCPTRPQTGVIVVRTRAKPSIVALAIACLAAGPTTQPTVDQRIDALLVPPPPPPVYRPPAARRGVPRPTGMLKVVPEGTQVVDQTGWLGHTADGKSAVFTFTAPPGDPASVSLPPMIVLPDLELEAMERRQAALGGGPAPFQVSGLVTEYRGRAYLRIDHSLDASEPDVGGRPPALAEGRSTDRTSGAAAVAPGSPVVPVMREGRPIFDQLGRLNRSADGQTDTLTFDADAKTMRDPPMILLPNLRLVTMEQQQLGLTKDVKFRVSGTVTEYRGRNYLLVDKAVVVQDFDADF